VASRPSRGPRRGASRGDENTLKSEGSPEAALAEILGALSAFADSGRPTQQGENGPPDSAPAACPICRLIERSVERALRTFFSEFVNDAELRLHFRKSRGFCRAHSRLLDRCGDALGVAIVCADLAESTAERWRAQALSAKPSLLARWRAMRSIPACTSCAAEAEAETRCAGALAAGLSGREDVWQALESGSALCVRHVERVASLCEPAVAGRLIAVECAKMDALTQELKEFVRKNDYRFRAEPWGAERDSWRRALLRLRR